MTHPQQQLRATLKDVLTWTENHVAALKARFGDREPWHALRAEMIRDGLAALSAGAVPQQEPQNLSLHRCKVCGTRWLLWPDAVHGGGWNLLDQWQRPGSCCDNAAMGDQIEHLRDIPLSAQGV